MNPASDMPCIAFEGDRCIATGDLRDVACAVKRTLDRRKDASVLVFDGMTGGPIDLDFRGTVDDVLARLPDMADTTATAEDAAAPAPRGPGRPKLGVVAREVTLLPRHWEWLAQQSGGASVALRRLVDEARRANKDKDRVRHAQEAAFIASSRRWREDKPHYPRKWRARCSQAMRSDSRRDGVLAADARSRAPARRRGRSSLRPAPERGRLIRDRDR